MKYIILFADLHFHSFRVVLFFQLYSRFYIWRRGVFLKMVFPLLGRVAGEEGVLSYWGGGLYHMERL